MTSAKTVQRTLRKPHIHQGKALQPGAAIALTSEQAQWLERLQVIEPAAANAKPAPSTTTASKE